MANGFPEYAQELVRTHQFCGRSWIGDTDKCPYCNRQKYTMSEEQKEGAQKLAKKLAQKPGGDTPWRTESITPNR